MKQTRRVRRLSSDVHVELTPMIDVVFLLLTFFVFSMVLMVRADVLDVKLPKLISGRSADRVVPVTIAVTQAGEIMVNGEPVAPGGVATYVKELQDQSADAPIVLAVDTRAQAGVMIALADELTGAGLGEFSIIGRRSDDPGPTDAPGQGAGAAEEAGTP